MSCICARSSSTWTFFILSILSQIGGTDEDERTPLSKSAPQRNRDLCELHMTNFGPATDATLGDDGRPTDGPLSLQRAADSLSPSRAP